MGIRRADGQEVPRVSYPSKENSQSNANSHSEEDPKCKISIEKAELLFRPFSYACSLIAS